MKEIGPQKDMYTHIHYIINHNFRKLKPPKYSLIVGGIKTFDIFYTLQYYSAISRNGLLIDATQWRHLSDFG